MQNIGKEITMQALSQTTSKEILYKLIPLWEPQKNEICYILDMEGNIHPIKIIDGQLWVTYGFSNFWHWINLETGKNENGYGGFYKLILKNKTGVK